MDFRLRGWVTPTFPQEQDGCAGTRLGAGDALQRPGKLRAFPLGFLSLTEPGAGFSPWFYSGAAKVICPPAFSFSARPAQLRAEGAERRGGLVPGIRGAQEVKPQPAAGTRRLRGGIIWPCQLLGPWAGGRHACRLAGSKEEQWIPLSPLIPAMFVTHVSGINPRLSSVLCSGGFHRKHPKVPCGRVRLTPVLVSTTATLLRTLFQECGRGMAHGSLETSRLPQPSPGNFQLLLGSPFHRGPPQGSPQLETSLVHTHGTSKTLVTPVNWHRDPTEQS